MITASEAYRKYKSKKNGYLTTEFFETKDLYIFDPCGDAMECIRKDSGDEDYIWIWDYLDLVAGQSDLKMVFLEEIFDDIKASYEKDRSEKNLAPLYRLCWNNLSWLRNIEVSDREMWGQAYEDVLSNTAELENYFHEIICRILENEHVKYPPCIEDPTDYFYRLKPFMVRNGYTVSMNEKRWVRI